MDDTIIREAAILIWRSSDQHHVELPGTLRAALVESLDQAPIIVVGRILLVGNNPRASKPARWAQAEVLVTRSNLGPRLNAGEVKLPANRLPGRQCVDSLNAFLKAASATIPPEALSDFLDLVKSVNAEMRRVQRRLIAQHRVCVALGLE